MRKKAAQVVPEYPEGGRPMAAHDGPQNEGGGAVVQGHVARQDILGRTLLPKRMYRAAKKLPAGRENPPRELSRPGRKSPHPMMTPPGRASSRPFFSREEKGSPVSMGESSPVHRGDGVHDNHAARHGGVEEGGRSTRRSAGRGSPPREPPSGGPFLRGPGPPKSTRGGEGQEEEGGEPRSVGGDHQGRGVRHAGGRWPGGDGEHPTERTSQGDTGASPHDSLGLRLPVAEVQIVVLFQHGRNGEGCRGTFSRRPRIPCTSSGCPCPRRRTQRPPRVTCGSPSRG